MLKNILKFSVANIAGLFLGVLSAGILTRIFTPDVYGILNIFNTTVTTGLSFLYFGLDSAFIRFYNEPPSTDTKEELGTKLLMFCLLITISFGLFCSIFYYKKFSTYVFGFDNRSIVIMIFISIFSQMILRFSNIKYRMEFNAKSYTLQSILTQVVSKFFVTLAAIFALKIEGVLMVNTMGVFFLSLGYIFIQRNSFFSFKNTFNCRNYGTLFLFALFSAPVLICYNINNFLTQQMIAHQLDMSKVGIYASVGYFGSVLGNLQGGFATFWAAYMYVNYSTKQEEIKRINEYLLLVVIIAYACIILGRNYVYLLIGKQYYESKMFFSLVLVYPIMTLASETTSYGLSIKKKTHLSLMCVFFSIVLNLTLIYLLLPLIGLRGAAVASMISGLLLYILKTLIGQYFYRSISDVRVTVIDVVIITLMALPPAFLSDGMANVITVALLSIALIINRERAKFLIMKIAELFTKSNRSNS